MEKRKDQQNIQAGKAEKSGKINLSPFSPFFPYDSPQTPFQRLLASPQLSPHIKADLRAAYQIFNPVQLKRSIDALIDRLYDAYQEKTSRPSLQIQPPQETSTSFGDIFGEATILGSVTWLNDLTRCTPAECQGIGADANKSDAGLDFSSNCDGGKAYLRPNASTWENWR